KLSQEVGRTFSAGGGNSSATDFQLPQTSGPEGSPKALVGWGRPRWFSSAGQFRAVNCFPAKSLKKGRGFSSLPWSSNSTSGSITGLSCSGGLGMESPAGPPGPGEWIRRAASQAEAPSAANKTSATVNQGERMR